MFTESRVGRTAQLGEGQLWAEPAIAAECMSYRLAASNVAILACISRSQSSRESADKLLDAGQDGLLIARENPMIGAVELDESRLRDVAGEMPAGADANGAVVETVEHQSRNGNSAQKMPHIHIAQRLEHALDGSRARRGPQQACPPGSCLRIARQARRERLDAGRPAPRLRRAAAATCHTD